MPSKYRSDAFAAIHETMIALRDAGFIGARDMRSFDYACLAKHRSQIDSQRIRPTTPIETDDEYRAALAEIDLLMNAEPGSEEGERLSDLVSLVEAYERRHTPV